MSGGANILTQHPGRQENSLVSATDLKTELRKSLRRRDSESKPHVFFISAVGEMNVEPHVPTALLQQIGDTVDEHLCSNSLHAASYALSDVSGRNTVR